eukprot:TRINITY_DN1395_c0_g1_i1.p1 TRINITY_DN1395_c0_g1~~TRINITY_DN1395_c0_g1_i1.p1  ORF type:complete len:114 (-),score=34.89 TRINITY_DN1395_c0_g1_i1:100-441(-)
MGQQLAIALKDPKNEENAKKIFEHYDTDKSGGLSKEEWVSFGKELFNIDKEETRQKINKSYFMGSWISGLMVNMLDINQFIEDMFLKADHNKDDNITYEEFKKFLLEHYENNK